MTEETSTLRSAFKDSTEELGTDSSLTGSPPTQLEKTIWGLFQRLPSGPITAARDSKDAASKKLAWSSEGVYPNLKVWVPANIESLGDDPLTQAALAACEVLRPSYFLSDEEFVPKELDAKARLYLGGISWALHGGKGKLVKYQDVSGSLGHGFYMVAHTALAAKLDTSAWWAKGTAWHFTKGMTGKAWSSDLDALTKRVNSLISKAAVTLDINDTGVTYFRSYESFMGSEIRKSIPHKVTELLSTEEKGYLDHRFAEPIMEYELLRGYLQDPTLNGVSGLAARVKRVGQLLQPLSVLVDSVVSHRIVGLYPSAKKERAVARKKPLKELVAALEIEKYTYLFDPALLAGKKPFRLSKYEEGSDEIWDFSAAKTDYLKSINGLPAAGYKDLWQVCKDWAEVVFGSIQIAE